MAEGRLFVCATPIGNLSDVSARLSETLGLVDVVYAEDTRRTAILLGHLGVSAPVRSLFTGNERARTEQLLVDLGEGLSVALVSDAGMPGISDPGAEAVEAARAAGHVVTVVPGPSAVTAAIALSGLGGGRFSFEGFLPRKGRERSARLLSVAGEDRPVVLFASPHRLGDDLADLREAAGGDRRVVVAREMTKLHEEVWSGSLDEAVDHWSGVVKGELTLVLAPGEPLPPSVDDAVERARELVSDGVPASEAARRVAGETGVRRRSIYQALIGDQGDS